MTRACIVLVMIAGLIHGAEPALSATATKATDAYAAAAAKIVLKAQQDILKEKERLIATLNKEKEAETRKGNLEAALAIKAKIEELAASRDLTTILEPETDLLGNPLTAVDSLDKPRNLIADAAAEELAEHLPKLTAAEWDKLGGMAATVDSRTGTVDTGVLLKDKDQVVVVPHPADPWTLGSGPMDSKPMTWQGDVHKDPGGRLRWGCLYVTLGEDSHPCGLIEGPGKLVLKCNDSGVHDNQGRIRVKILKVVDGGQGSAAGGR
ncbi:MAG: hypothetical protein H0W72_03240 [Planctomycetes bacterium]|nr:hypothetical protein [Planctomycetota bacterium]